MSLNIPHSLISNSQILPLPHQEGDSAEEAVSKLSLQTITSSQSLPTPNIKRWIVSMTGCDPLDVTAIRKTNYLRRIKDEEWQPFALRLEQNGRKATEDELKAFQQGDWEHPVFKNPNWDLSAFYAFLEGRLDESTMNKLFLYRECCEQIMSDGSKKEELQTYQLYNTDGQLNETAKKKLQWETRKYLNQDQFETLLQEMKNLPPEKTQFFLINRTADGMLEQHFQFTSSHWLLGVSRLWRDKNKWKATQFVVPPDVICLIHRARFKENGMNLVPHLGYSPIEKLSDPLNRPMSMTSFFNLPNKLHGLKASGLSSENHDAIYHGGLESANQHRPLWSKYAKYLIEELNSKILSALPPQSTEAPDAADQLAALQKLIKPFVSELIESALDREILTYFTDRKDDSSTNFWIALENYLNRSKTHWKLNFHHKNTLPWEVIENALLDCFAKMCREEAAHGTLSLLDRYDLNRDSLNRSLNQSAYANTNENLKALAPKLLSRMIY